MFVHSSTFCCKISLVLHFRECFGRFLLLKQKICIMFLHEINLGRNAVESVGNIVETWWNKCASERTWFQKHPSS